MATAVSTGLGLRDIDPARQEDVGRLIVAVWLLREALAPITEGGHVCVHREDRRPEDACLLCRLQEEASFVRLLIQKVPAFQVERGLCYGNILDSVKEVYWKVQDALDGFLREAQSDAPAPVAMQEGQ